MNKIFFRMLVALIVAVSFALSCKKTTESATESDDSDSAGYLVESSMSDISDQAGSIVTAGFFESSSINTLATCSIASARSACSSNTTTINWGGCSVGTLGVATLAGTITETFSGFGAAVCQLNGNGSTITRVLSSSNPRTLTFTSGAKIVSSMSPGTAYDGTTFPSASTGTTVQRLESGTSNGESCSVGSPCYNIVVNGIRNVFTGRRGATIFDHIIQSNTTVKGSRTTGTFSVAGSSTVWHQSAQYKATHTYAGVQWSTSTCCYPTNGTISSAFSGSLSGSTSMVFSSTCGSATFTNTSGSASAYTLSQCQP